MARANKGQAKGKRGATKQAAPVAPALPTAPASETPRRRGRPTKYDPAMCEVVLQLGEDGASRAMIAKELGISRQTMAAWEKAHPEFLSIVKEAEDLSLAWWETQGRKAIWAGKDFNATAFIFQMKNRFRDNYSENVNVKHDATADFAKIWSVIGQGATP